MDDKMFSLEMSILIILITVVASLVGDIYPGIIGTSNDYNMDEIIGKVDGAGGNVGSSGNPLDGVPVLGDLVTMGNSFLASLGLLGAIIKNLVYAYGFFVWLGFPVAYALAGQTIVGLFHVRTLIYLKWGR
jgi:hypothetical protein